MSTILKVLKLKTGATFTDPRTGITIKQGEPPEFPSDPILFISEFKAFRDGSKRTAVRISYDVYSSFANFQNAKSQVYTGSIIIKPDTLAQVGVIPVEAGTLNTIEAIESLAYGFMLYAPEFQAWEIDTVEIPDPVVVEPEPILEENIL